MKFSAVSSFAKRLVADLLVIPYWQTKKGIVMATHIPKLDPALSLPIELGDFKGKEGEVALLYQEHQPEKRVLLLGLGKENAITIDNLRQAYAAATKVCHRHKMKTMSIVLPETKQFSRVHALRGAVEGILSINYVFDQLKGSKVKEEPTVLLEHLIFVGESNKALETAKRALCIAEGVNFARDLINGNAEEVTPQRLAEVARQMATQHKKIKATLFDKKRIEKEGMGLLLAVNQGSPREPVFIILEYKGDPRSKDHTVLIGKGVTYDTGGLDLKPSGSMLTMKSDMSGAAAVLGTMLTTVRLGLKVNLTIVVAATENCIGSKSYKPGDVFKSYLGKTVEIGNTDAEGRLTLADALAYANANLAPTRMINLATLTGGVVVALGDQITGLMSNNDKLVNQLTRASETAGEPLWRLPLRKEYREFYKSDIADIKNCGSGRAASSITGGLFLEDFVSNTPWAHFDIAGTAFLTKGRGYLPQHASGIGVRTLVEFLESF